MAVLFIVATVIVVLSAVVAAYKLHSRFFVSRAQYGKSVSHIAGLQLRIDNQPEAVGPVDQDAVILDALQKLSGMLHHNAQFGLRFLSDMGLPQGTGVVGFLTAYVESLPKQKQQQQQQGNGKPKSKPKPEQKPETYEIPPRN